MSQDCLLPRNTEQVPNQKLNIIMKTMGMGTCQVQDQKSRGGTWQGRPLVYPTERYKSSLAEPSHFENSHTALAKPALHRRSCVKLHCFVPAHMGKASLPCTSFLEKLLTQMNTLVCFVGSEVLQCGHLTHSLHIVFQCLKSKGECMICILQYTSSNYRTCHNSNSLGLLDLSSSIGLECLVKCLYSPDKLQVLQLIAKTSYLPFSCCIQCCISIL